MEHPHLRQPPAPTVKTALVLQGGGARGAYHVGALRAIAQLTSSRRSPFQIICGASVGAINAASIAYAANDYAQGTLQLERLWRGLTTGSVYECRALPVLMTSGKWALTLALGRLGPRASGGFLDNSPLASLLTRELDHRHLRRAIRTRALHALCITASSYDAGRSVTFFEGHEDIPEWVRDRRISRRTQITTDHLMASSALPFAFAPVRLEGGYFGDGALRSTSPLSSAVHTGADRIMAIGARDTLPDLPDEHVPHQPPTAGAIAGRLLDIMFNDFLEADHQRLVRVNQTVSLISDGARGKTPLKEIETVMLSPSKDMRDIAKKHAASLPRPVRLLLRSIGATGGDGQMESYLMFEPGYIADLIDLGFADTMARADEIAAFLR